MKKARRLPFHTVAGAMLVFALSVVLASPLVAEAQTTSAGGPEETSLVTRPNQRVWVTTADGRERHGTLVSFSATELVLHQDKTDITIPRSDVRSVQIAASPGGAMRFGSLVGAVAGAALSWAETGSSPSGFKVRISVTGAAMGAVAGAGLGAALGRWKDGRQALYLGTTEPGLTAAGGPHARESKVWVTTTNGQSIEGSLVSFSAAGLEVRREGGVSRVPFAELRVVEVPRPLGWALLRGAVFGAVAFGLPLLSAPNPCCGSRGFPALAAVSVLAWGVALGSGAGALGASSSHKRDVVYSSGARASVAPEVCVAPILAPRRAGLSVRIVWR